jgi:hypothetical protein
VYLMFHSGDLLRGSQGVVYGVWRWGVVMVGDVTVNNGFRCLISRANCQKG